jgi:flagellar hook capping protein FlgD
MASNNGTLWVGGEFSKAGGETSFHLAKWIEGPRKAALATFTAERSASRTIIQVIATYLPFDHQGFLIYRQPIGEPQVLVTPNPIQTDEFSVIDPTPPLGPVTYKIAGIASTGLVTEYASTEVAADPALRFALLPIRPNPFHAQATITFHNAKAGQMQVAVFDLSGRRVADLLDETLPPGAHSVTWNGRDAAGHSVAAGAYFCRVSSPEGTLVERLVRSGQ